MEEPRNEFKYYSVVAALFVATILISNTTASKLFTLWEFIFPAGIIIFPISYILGDILTEVYGYVRARRVIWTGLAAAVLMAFAYWLVIKIPPAAFWEGQEAFEFVLGQVPRIVLATIVGFLVGEFLNAFVLAKMKILTGGKHLWSRTIGSTIVGQGADTVIFIAIAFAGKVSTSELVVAMISVYLFKVFYEAFATPLTYLVVGFLKKREGIDHFDTDTKFSPFRWD